VDDATGKRDYATDRIIGDLHNHALPPCNTHYSTLVVTMEDTTMMEASQGLFEEQSFTIIPNGLSDDRLEKVCDAPRMERSIADAFYSSASKSLLSAVPSYLLTLR
jgi:hypothetical protein